MVFFFNVSKNCKSTVFLLELWRTRKHWKEARVVKLRQFSSDSAADSYTATLFCLFFSVQIAFARLKRIFLLLLFNVFFVFCRNDLSVELQASERESFRNRPEPKHEQIVQQVFW